MHNGFWSPLLRATVPCAPLTGRIAQAPAAPHPTTILPSSVSRVAHSSMYHNRLMIQMQRKRALNSSQKGDRTSSGSGTDLAMQLEPSCGSRDPLTRRTAEPLYQQLAKTLEILQYSQQSARAPAPRSYGSPRADRIGDISVASASYKHETNSRGLSWGCETFAGNQDT